MKKHPTFLLTVLTSLALSSPSAMRAQDPCETLEIVIEWGCIGESNGWAVVDEIIGVTGYPTSILWSTGEDVQFITGLPSGEHWVTVTDVNGCSVQEHFTVDCEKDCELEIAVEWGCLGESDGWASVDIFGATNPTTILWSTGENVQYITGLESGEHWVMVTDADECWLKYEFEVDCEKDEEPCELRTQTMGGWGAPAAGNNPGVYRDAHFAAAFPMGLTIGCTNTLMLTSASAVQTFLPSGGQPQQLPAGNMVDPGNYNNTLAGQLVALTLSVGFDNNDPDFGSGGLLADAVINNGLFEGWTVQELLDEANNFIGGCGSSYTASQLNNALSMVNENFVDGTTNNGNLDCALGDGLRMLISADAPIEVRAYPIPATTTLNMDIRSYQSGMLSFILRDGLGRTVLTRNNEAFDAGELRTVMMDINGLGHGIYMLTTLRDGKLIRTDRVMISR